MSDQLSVLHLRKQFNDRIVVNDTSFNVESGEVVGLLGPNGAGKTTCFYMIAGLVKPDEGKIELEGQEITFLPMHERARLGLGYLPQEASIFRKLRWGRRSQAGLNLSMHMSKRHIILQTSMYYFKTKL